MIPGGQTTSLGAFHGFAENERPRIAVLGCYRPLTVTRSHWKESASSGPDCRVLGSELCHLAQFPLLKVCSVLEVCSHVFSCDS
jgi:hypothetical protein